MDSDSDFSPESIHYKIGKLLFKMNNLIRVANRFENIERQLLAVEKELNELNADNKPIPMPTHMERFIRAGMY